MFTKLEFAVQMPCSSCVDKIQENLIQNGILKSNIHISYETGTVIVNTDQPSSLISNYIEKTGMKAVLKGYGSATSDKNLGSAVAILGGSTGHSNVGINGVVRFVQINENECVVDGTIDGLSPGKHGIYVYECGDLSSGCERIGGHLNLEVTKDNESKMHTGDLGNITANEEGRAIFYLKDKSIHVSHLIGRSVGVTEHEDRCGQAKINVSGTEGNNEKAIACGIIARASGLFENSKKICACDGVTLWEERDVPLAGPGRQRKL